MSQQKNKRWWRIRTKIFVWLFLAFISGCFALTYSIDRQTNSRNETQIRKDINTLRDTTTVYVRQTLIMNGGFNNEESFRTLATNIISDLYGASMRHVALYTNKGYLLTSTRNALFTQGNMADLVKVQEGDASYTIVRDTKDALYVYFSMPVIVAGRQVGIVRYYIDYTDLLISGRENESTILRVAIIIFILTFIIVTFSIQMLLSPLQQLASMSNEVTDDLNNGRFDEKRYLSMVHSERKDELGDLTNNYKVMLQTVQNQLEKLQSDKNEIYDLMQNRKEFYDNVTHELKTPLTTINGYAQLLQDNGTSDPELFQKGIQSIIDESVRLHKMVIQLLEMSNYEQQKKWEDVDIISILKDVVAAMELKAHKYGSDISFDNDHPIILWAQKERLREVFINIIDNAIKYGANPQTIRIAIKKTNEWLEVHIINNGKGLSNEEIQHIFEPFYRVDKQYSREQGSAGLGLSICMRIMKEHQGEVAVVSVQDKTTTFIIRLPSHAK